MELNKQTKVTVSIGVILSAAAGIYAFADNEIGMRYELASNSAQLQTIQKQGIARQISDKNSERRGLESEIRRDPNDSGAIRDLDAVRDEIKALEFIQKCIDDPLKRNC